MGNWTPNLPDYSKLLFLAVLGVISMGILGTIILVWLSAHVRISWV